MPANPTNGRLIRFGVFEADLRSGELRKSGVRIRLREQAFQVLAALLERPVDIVTSEELRDRLWPDGTFVDFDHSLNAAVNSIREVLGDSAASPRFVETLPRRGYRFVAPVERAGGSAPEPKSKLPQTQATAEPETAGEQGSPGEPRRHSRSLYVGLGAAVAVLIAVLAHYGARTGDGPAATGNEGAASSERPSIAVLPLENVGGGEENEYFSDGVTDDIIAQLSKIRALKVISRISSVQYKNTSKGLHRIGEELGVGTVLQGSVRRSGDRIRIVAQLMAVESDETLWAQTSDRDLTDVFAVQSEIAQRIAEALHAELSGEEIVRVDKRGTANLEAYEFLLRARYEFDRYTKAGWEQALENFQKAIELDPNYAPAHAGIARCYQWLFEPRMAREAVARALEIDETLAEAHVSLAWVRLRDWDWEGANKASLRGIELDPNSAEAYRIYAGYLSTTGSTAEAVEAVQKARELNPHSLRISAQLGWALRLDRRYDEAIRHFKSITMLDPSFHEAWRGLGYVYVAKGMYREAIESLQTSIEIGGLPPESDLGALGHAYARLGETGRALEILDQIKASPSPRTGAFYVAQVYTGLGDNDKALDWLERGYERHVRWLPHINVSPFFEPVRSEPRFQALLKKMGLAD